MTTEDKVMITILGVFFIAFSGLISYTLTHGNGYMKGIWHSQLYYQATGEFPSEDWVKMHEGDKFYYTEEILKTLEAYKKLK